MTEENPDTDQETESRTADDSVRYWLTNDFALFLILGTYMGVWAVVHLSPLLVPLLGMEPVTLEMPLGADLTAQLVALGAATWAFGEDLLDQYQQLKGGGK